MLLCEIKINTPNSWSMAVQAFAEKHDFTVKKGGNAYVLVRDDSDSVYRAWINDPGYEHWIQYAQQHQNNPHIVKLLSRVRVMPIEKMAGTFKNMTVKLVKIEKLTPLVGHKLEYFVGITCGTIHDHKPSELQNMTVESLAKQLAPHLKEDAQFVVEQRSFVETALELARAQANDMNSENVMLRGNTLVITDPYGS